MRVVAIIQARMGSSRLPGKVLMPLAGRPVVEHVVTRLRSVASIADVAIATTTRDVDDPLAAFATTLGVPVVRGDENDVLSRYGKAAEVMRADAILRITADCPLVDPDVVNAIVSRFIGGQSEEPPVDLVTNARVRTFPRGLDAELFSRRALDVMLANTTRDYEREHVTPYLYDNPDCFRIMDVVSQTDLSGLRWTLDTPEDFELLSRIFSSSPDDRSLRLADVLSILEAHPDWSRINAHIEQKTYK